ncbi:hypothetical protein C2I06_23095 [Niallia circulans]|uniref:Uncharacterized protein n=1 Tax=Niallia circulans TaxID=1397 RepID=A0A268FB98_NIACI|nr:hypothetical protein C2I06_23095 [Niallia circulans]PAD82651.1 hypothetical protein CHH57_13715 [Niallia circulans]
MLSFLSSNPQTKLNFPPTNVQYAEQPIIPNHFEVRRKASEYINFSEKYTVKFSDNMKDTCLEEDYNPNMEQEQLGKYPVVS